MSSIGELYVVKDTLEEKELHWRISDFFSLDICKHWYSPYFKFLQSNWYFTVDTSEDNDEDFLGLWLNMVDVKKTYVVECTFAIKKDDGSKRGIHFFKHAFSSLNTTLFVHKYFSRVVLSNYQQELMPSKILTIMCHLKFTDPVKDTIAELNTLSEDFKSLLSDEEFCDTTLHVKETEFKAHKLILAARSPVFAAMFRHETAEKKSGIVNIPDCDPDSFPEFLQFLYCGKLEKFTSHSALHLYKTADKYDVQKLKKYCIEYMRNNLNIENFCNIVVLADEYDEVDLLTAAQFYFNRNLSEIFYSDAWKELLKKKFNLANKLLKQMSLKVIVVE